MNKEDLKSIRDNLLRLESNPFKRFKIHREYKRELKKCQK
jgi:hypothetical protein